MLIIKKIQDNYVLPGKTLYGNMKINGELYTNLTATPEFVMHEEPVSIARILNKQTILEFKSVDKEILSVEKYNKEISRFNELRDENDYLTAEDEYDYRKFTEKWTAVVENTEYDVEIPFTIIDIEGDISNPYILPFRFIGKQPITETNVLYTFKSNPYKMCQEIGEELGFVEVKDSNVERTKGFKWSIPKHSKKDLKFLKINGTYQKVQGIFLNVTHGTWDECFNRYLNNYDAIKSCFEFEKICLEKPEVSETSRKEILTELNNILNSVRDIDAKVKEHHKKQKLINTINKLIKALTTS